jgi:uncharacterized protein (DUF2236 family)
VAELERSLEALIASTGDPRAGLFGPTSEVWQKNGEAIVFAGAGRAALLQLAHPAVAHAVDEFSITREDRLLRFRRTFHSVFAMVFGDLSTAVSVARTVGRLHERVHGVIRDDDAGPFFPRGTPYRADDPDAQLWVASTLFDSSAWVFERLVRPLTAEEQARWIAEYPRFTGLFGIPSQLVPSTWRDFVDYNRRMWASPILTVSRTGRALADVLCTPPSPSLAPFWRWYRSFTAGSLPDRIRQQFGFPWGAKERAAFAISLAALSGLHRSLPRRARMLPAYARALARVESRPESWFDRAVDHLLFGHPAKL